MFSLHTRAAGRAAAYPRQRLRRRSHLFARARALRFRVRDITTIYRDEEGRHSIY